MNKVEREVDTRKSLYQRKYKRVGINLVQEGYVIETVWQGGMAHGHRAYAMPS